MDEYKINRGIFAFMVILCFFLVCYQYYLERIFYEMWIKVWRSVNKGGVLGSGPATSTTSSGSYTRCGSRQEECGSVWRSTLKVG